ncbi:hypothetical protein GF412_04565 [Candidatus Micrarchaeota archaeon]|nr:hypothetical protein [Candidatus Micrarchaeota archaeon]MBD3418225.1 hypothetical protein [Candidatus Micrarchaeota archaeon]
MTNKEEPKKAQEPASSCTGEGKVWLIALLGFLVGLLVMYLAMPALFPTETAPAEEPSAEAEEEEEFTLDEVKVEEIRQLLADTYLLNTGQDVEVTFARYEENPNHIALYYSVMGQEMPLYVSKDYEYIYPSALERESMETDLAAAKAQYLEALENQPEETEMEPEGYPTSEEPEVYLHVMSNCPYGNIAENAIVDVVSLLEEDISFEPVYIIYDESIHPSYSAESGECLVDENNVTYCSMHGMYELEQGIREKMVYNRYGEAMWAEYAAAVNEVCFSGGQDIENCWKLVADDLGIDTTEIEGNFETEKFTILAREKNLTFSTQKFGSPALTINGVDYSGSRSAESYKEAICSAFDSAPEDCTVGLSEEQEGPDGQC